MNTEDTIDLIRKYNVPGPRYTSYPTVPYWDSSAFSLFKWQDKVKDAFNKYNAEGISLYIHLPFCESLCTYCGCTTRITVNHAVEEPYIETVLREWALYKKIFNSPVLIKEIHLGGGTPTFFKPENLEKLIQGLLKENSVADKAEFSFEGHPNNTSDTHLKTLYDLGFRRISLGIQDFDPKVQKTVNRVQSFETVRAVTESARTTGYTSVNYDLIYGLPFQTIRSVRDTIEKTCMLNPDRIAFYSYAHVPWIKPGQRKFSEADLPSDSVKRDLYEMGRNMLEDQGYHEIGMDHFAFPGDSLFHAMKKKSLHRNFMGYTSMESHLMIGLGASSISDTWDAFAQNIKSVEEYAETVDHGILPVFRGHMHDKEDKILRKHILNLMCHMKTNWNNADEQSEKLFEGLNRLTEIEKDGLIELKENSLSVTEKGRPFLRNICMAMDARMWADKPSSKIFSSTI
jgi:oxygen-independent coproporphyrinogen III oxidase